MSTRASGVNFGKNAGREPAALKARPRKIIGAAAGADLGITETLVLPQARGAELPLPKERSKTSLAEMRLRFYAALFLIDASALTLGFMFANLVRFGDPIKEAGLTYLIAFAPIFLAINFTSGAYSVGALEQPRTGVMKTVKALAITACALLLVFFYTRTSEVMSRAVFAVGVFTTALLVAAGRHSFGHVLGMRRNWIFQNDLVLVDGSAIVPPAAGRVVYAQQAGLNFHMGEPEFAYRVGQLLDGCDRVILSCNPDSRLRWMSTLKGAGIDVEVLTPELDYLGARALRSTPNGAAVLVAVGALGIRDRIVKRAMDLVVASIVLVIVAPLLVAVSLLIPLTSPGPVLFRQRRLGRSNRPFEVLKFRTMRVDACDPHGDRSTKKSDDRFTPLGAFLRHTSVDELPQLFNVLKGDMSIVGPRPHALGSTAEDSLFWHVDDRYWHRAAVKPGITGLAQVRGFRGATDTRKDLTDRVGSDIDYLNDWTIWKDLLIIIRTARVILHPNAF